jgi:hypothetical protein
MLTRNSLFFSRVGAGDTVSSVPCDGVHDRLLSCFRNVASNGGEKSSLMSEIFVYVKLKCAFSWLESRCTGSVDLDKNLVFSSQYNLEGDTFSFWAVFSHT